MAVVYLLGPGMWDPARRAVADPSPVQVRRAIEKILKEHGHRVVLTLPRANAFDRPLEAALRLKPRQRAVLADLLEGSLPGPLELGPEWEAEIARRVEEVKSGKAKLIPLEDLFGGSFRKTLPRRGAKMRSGKVKGVTAEGSLRDFVRRAGKRRSR